MAEFQIPSLNSRIYAFHMEVSGYNGIELYGYEGRGLKLCQSFYAPRVEERVRPCMVTINDHRIVEVCTIKDLTEIPFGYGEKNRSVLSEDEIKEFARHGLKVVTLDKIG